ncbi:MAG: (d)CMP kinase [Planctomycetota bacterium]
MGKPIITIDGPAGAGKSTVAKGVAERLGLKYLDTGAMYRAATWKAQQEGIPLTDGKRVAELIRRITIKVEGEKVWVDGADVSAEIRRNEVSNAVKPVADSTDCRAELVKLQQEAGRAGGLVVEGRDQGTVVFPDADLKFYLDAAPGERGRRRAKELKGRGQDADEARIRKEIEERDRADMSRPVGALRRPDDAIAIDTGGMTVDEVVDRICQHVQAG